MKLPKVYEPGLYESDIYALWEKSEAFTPTGKGEPYSIVMPPPNANGNAHLGTALTLYLEDIAARYQRLQGKDVLLLPGADHAGFETQAVYEKQLAKEGKSRFDFTRDELYGQIWDFVAQNRQNFESQFRQLGGGLDWTRYTFTLDTGIVNQAYATFKKMWDEGLVYRGERLVNYCTFHGTAFADIEVSHKEEKGTLWHIRYLLVDGTGEITVATTRPETLFGDVAIAVHPDDERYRQFIGKTVTLPLTHREIPIIADDFVDPKFGTGAVKITPAHDQNDYDAGQRHDLPQITVIDHEGKLNSEVPKAYRGLTVQEGRDKTVADLESQDFLVKQEVYPHTVGHCYKCDTVIQPLLREQWFINMQPLAKEAIEALEAKKVVFHPDSKRIQLITYLKGLRDWNISRQIAWGIPIPAFQNVNDANDWIYDDRVGQEVIEVDGKTYHRDPDVFDTWFSSSSWPYATLNFIDKDNSKDYEQYYPLSLMETGGEILYPWVSRMLMLGLYVTGEVPFKEVYIHGYIMAEDGAKMSKSLGNVINPIDVIATHGSDAVRMGLIASRSAAVNRGYDPRKVEEARNFCNKLWNIARYVEDIAGEGIGLGKPKPESAADHWMLSKLQHTTESMATCLDTYQFSEAYNTLYHFVWDDFADWYIEASKAAPNKSLLVYGLRSILQLAHPFAPFVSETIWQTLNLDDAKPDSLLVTSKWPEVKAGNAAASQEFETIKTIIGEVRYLTRVFDVRDLTLYYIAQGESGEFFERNSQLITKLGRLEAVVASPIDIVAGVHLTQITYTAWLDIDVAKRQKYLKELQNKRQVQEKSMTSLQNRLNNKQYLDNAPKEVVAQTESQLEEAKAVLDNIIAEHERFEK